MKHTLIDLIKSEVHHHAFAEDGQAWPADARACAEILRDVGELPAWVETVCLHLGILVCVVDHRCRVGSISTR